MKILHLETGQNLYGGAKQVQFLIHGLNKQGVRNHLCCPEGSEIGKAVSNCEVHHTRSAGDLDFKFYFDLKKILFQVEPDLVHIHSRRGADMLGAIAVKSAGFKCVLSRRVDNPENVLLAKIKYPLYSHVITISEGIKTVLEKQKVPAKHISCVRSAVDYEKYQHPATKERFLEAFNLNPSHVTVGVVAQLIGRKGHKYLIDIAAKLKELHPELQILIFGKGAKEGELKALSAQLGTDDFIKFVGFHKNIEDWLGNIDIIAHPAEMEGLGVALLQSSSAGVPIVASRVGGIPEIVRDQDNGLLQNTNGAARERDR